MTKFLLIVEGIVIGVTAMTASYSFAGVIRHDVPDSSYTDLAAQPDFASVGIVTAFDGGGGPTTLGSATLIDTTWLLTAAHLLSFPAPSSVSVNIGGTDYTATEWTAHPSWNDELGEDYDIGLIRLSTPVTGVSPAVRSGGPSERGAEVTMVGFGQTGTGLTGEQEGTGGTKRAGHNVLDEFGNVLGNSTNYWMADFDNPTSPSDSSIGESSPLALEYSIAGGDSGGGVFVNDRGLQKLVGVVSFGQQGPKSNPDQTPNYAAYGDLMGISRLTNSWIDEQIYGFFYWGNTDGGSFEEAGNWAQGFVPGEDNVAVLGEDAAYTVTLGANATNRRLHVKRGMPTLDLGGNNYTLSMSDWQSSLVVGGNDNATLTVTNGTLSAVDAKIQTTRSYSELILGSGAVLNVSGSMIVSGNTFGGPRRGSLTVQSGGELHVAGELAVHSSPFDERLVTIDGLAVVNSLMLDITHEGITGSGELRITGPSTWTSGHMEGGGTTTITQSGHLAITTSRFNERPRLEDRVIDNFGSIILNGTDEFNMTVDSVINNKPGAVVEVHDADATSGTINNEGVFRKSSGEGTAGFNGTKLNNDGRVEVLSGRLSIFGGQKMSHSGTFYAAAGATLSLSNWENAFNAGSALEGPGSFEFRGGNSIFNVPVTIQNLLLKQSVISEISGPGTVAITESMTWEQGILSGNGETIIAPGAVLDMTAPNSSVSHSLRRNIVNDGTIRWHGGRIWNDDSPNVTNLPDRLFDIAFSEDESHNWWFNSGTENLLDNQGILRKSTGSGQATIGVRNGSSGYFEVKNTGTIEVQAGTLRFLDLYTHSAGRIVVENGSTFSTLRPITIQSGGIEGTGIIDSVVENHGTISPGGSPGKLTFNGNLTLFDDSEILIEVGGLVPESEFDQIVVDGSVVLDGLLDVSLITVGADPFVPTLGDEFEILTATDEVTGVFATELLPTLATDMRFDVLYDYDANRVLLAVIERLVGDYNDNGTVEQADLDLVLLNWGATWPIDGPGWVNDQPTDGAVDQNDLDSVLLNWGNTAVVSASVVPEPMTWLLLLVAVIGGGSKHGRLMWRST